MKKTTGFVVCAQALEKYNELAEEILIMNKAITREVKLDCETGKYHDELSLTEEEQEIFEKHNNLTIKSKE